MTTDNGDEVVVRRKRIRRIAKTSIDYLVDEMETLPHGEIRVVVSEGGVDFITEPRVRGEAKPVSDPRPKGEHVLRQG